MLTIAFVAVLAGVPPLPPFPTETRPVDASTAPQNARVFLVGDPAPTVDSIGLVVTYAGAPAAVASSEKIGCCAIVATLAAQATVGDAVVVQVTSPTGDRSFGWTAGVADDTAPAFVSDPVVLDHQEVDPTHERMVIAVEVSDNTQVGLIKALAGTSVVGVGTDGFTLVAIAPKAAGDLSACVDVVVVDVAGNEAGTATPACAPLTPGEGEGDVDGAECEGPGDMPVNVPSTSVILVLLALLGIRRRR